MTEAASRPLLLVEDDADLRESLAELLQGEGYRVVQAHNGREALGLLAHTRPFLILLDLMMPEMDGAQFLAALQASGDKDAGLRAIPVLVLTAAASAIPTGGQVCRIVRKPIRFEQFLPLLRAIYDEAAAKG